MIDLLNTVCKEGKKISVQLKIIDAEKAINIMSTMYQNENKENDTGVEVYSWGKFDLVKAYEIRDAAINHLRMKQEQEMSELLHRELESFIE